MNTNKEDMRELAAQLYAVVVSTMTGNELQTAVQNLVKTTKDSHVCYCLLFYCFLHLKPFDLFVHTCLYS